MGLRLNLSLAEIWQKCYFLYLLRNWHYVFSSPEPVVSWSRGRETRVGYKLSRVALGTRHFAEVEKVHGSDDKAQIGHAQFYPCSPLPWESFQVSNKMPDYLGKDQRKIKDDEKKDDKPIQGASDTLNHTKSRRDLLVTRLTSFSLRLHMETRIQIFD